MAPPMNHCAADLKTRSIATFTQDANKQHYEVPAAFYDTVMGPHKKYSCGYWPRPNMTLEESEVAALELVCARAGITDSGMKVLDMGCGWGSVTLFVAARFPKNSVRAVSNSASQREYIMAQVREERRPRLLVLTRMQLPVRLSAAGGEARPQERRRCHVRHQHVRG